MSIELEKVITDGRYGPLMDYATTLTERLAQAERERDEAVEMCMKLKSELERIETERDGWRECAKRRLGDVNTACTERDAALAKAEEAERALADVVRTCQEAERVAVAEMAKAEAAESELADRIKSAQHYGHEAALAHEQLTDLRARIEALAVKREASHGTEGIAFDLRALLTPPKAETALELFDKIVDDCIPSDLADNPHVAKLRNLLEEEPGRTRCAHGSFKNFETGMSSCAQCSPALREGK